MERRKKIFSGVVIFIFVGIALIYYRAHREEKQLKVDSLKNEHFASDSLTESHREEMPIEAGARPEKSPKDGSVKMVEEFIKSTAKNPDTFEFLEWSEVSFEGGYWKVRCKYRGVSSFNAEVTTNAWFYIRNHKVVHTKIISKI